ncbi:Family of unknown function (DUF648) [Chlamydia serpentis]|uniref:Uncharacterized protein n=1 Tax=Chlamydia serpentis TaxID=1967782 RepID=A0A2R8FCD4_9CHLA|nr:DUF648 domain-containing protein [Chlamydia serpentis]SPN74083.1 Family of unknown function (DUF648) [Chlamydia serpentis]
MLSYTFDSSVSPTFQHRFMAGIDNWFFLGGNRVKIIRLRDSNFGYAVQENVSLSIIKKILKILSYILIPIVIVALLIRYFLHSRFTYSLEHVVDKSAPRFFANLQRRSICNGLKYAQNPLYFVSFSADVLRSLLPPVTEIPEANRLKNYIRDGQFIEGAEGIRKYLSNMLNYVIGCLGSIDRSQWTQLMKETKIQAYFDLRSFSFFRFVSPTLERIVEPIFKQESEIDSSLSIQGSRCFIIQCLKVYCERRYSEVVNSKDLRELIVSETGKEFFCPITERNLYDQVDQQCQRHLLERILHRSHDQLCWNDFTFSIIGDSMAMWIVEPIFRG